MQSLYVFQNLKALAHDLIPASLCEGPFFYFYVESSSYYFMHQLREHSCHSEYNVHSPKIYYWLIHDCYCLFSNYLYLVTLWTFKRCPGIYVFLFHEGQAEYHFAMFSLCSKQTFYFQCFIIHDLLFVLLVMLQHGC